MLGPQKLQLQTQHGTTPTSSNSSNETESQKSYTATAAEQRKWGLLVLPRQCVGL